MAFIVETGAGNRDSTSYVTLAFVLAYLTDRGRETESTWSTASTAEQQEACIAATSYIDKRWGPAFKGSRLRPALSGRVAKATVAFTANPLDTETVTAGPKVYRFVATLAAENDVLIGATLADSLTNLVTAITDGGDDVTVHEDTLPSDDVSAAIVDGTTDVLVASLAYGENGNTIALATDVTGAAASSATLVGGLDAGPQAREFPRSGLYRNGRMVTGIPIELREATAEYAVRALAHILAPTTADPLDPDPTVDATGVPVQRKREKVGPIETEVEYVPGAVTSLLRPYPAADRLLRDFVVSGGSVIR